MLLPIQEDAGDEAQAEGDAERLVGMLAHVLIGHAKAGGSLFFETATACFDTLQGFHQLYLRLFSEVAAGGFDEIFRVMDERDQIFYEALLRAFLASHVLEKRFHRFLRPRS